MLDDEVEPLEPVSPILAPTVGHTVLLAGCDTPVPIPWLAPSTLLAHLAHLEWVAHPHYPAIDTAVPIAILTHNVSAVLIEMVVQYLLLCRGDPDTADGLKAFITQVMNRDKLADELASGATTLAHEHIVSERNVVAVLNETSGTEWATSLLPYEYPDLARMLNQSTITAPRSGKHFKLKVQHGALQISPRYRALHYSMLRRRKSRAGLFQSTKREYLFDLMAVATYLDMTHLLQLLSRTIDTWRKGVPLMARTWYMARHTRAERLAAVELVVQLRKQQLADRRRKALFLTRKPEPVPSVC
jgi:hypothetical protein